mmetsp:Transcript_87508/g.220860  ORF Transcript_87508/g.220860 Transcript_87508/m.220860 type:complete len:108 (-) Transcript_87508:75-398(-)
MIRKCRRSISGRAVGTGLEIGSECFWGGDLLHEPLQRSEQVVGHTAAMSADIGNPFRTEGVVGTTTLAVAEHGPPCSAHPVDSNPCVSESSSADVGAKETPLALEYF